MGWPGVTINAAMLTTTVGIQAGGKADIRAVISGNNGLAVVLEKLRAAGSPPRRDLPSVALLQRVDVLKSTPSPA
jgi:hypothetical protein